MLLLMLLLQLRIATFATFERASAKNRQYCKCESLFYGGIGGEVGDDITAFYVGFVVGVSLTFGDVVTVFWCFTLQ